MPLPNETRTIRAALEDIVKVNAVDVWLDAPNSAFGGNPPRSLIGTSQEEQLWDMIYRIEYGVYG